MSPLLLIGDSHCSPIKKALKSRYPSAEPVLGGGIGAATVFFDPFYDMRGDRVHWLHPRLVENFEHWSQATGVTDLLREKRRLVVSLGLAGAPFYGNRMWSQFTPDGRTRHHISSGVTEAMVAAMQEHVLCFYSDLAAKDLIRAAVAGPAPQRRHRAVDRLGQERVVELDLAFRAPVEKHLRHLGVHVVDVPASRDEQGMLKAEFWGDDPAHGSAEFGQCIVDELLALPPSKAAALAAAPP